MPPPVDFGSAVDFGSGFFGSAVGFAVAVLLGAAVLTGMGGEVTLTSDDEGVVGPAEPTTSTTRLDAVTSGGGGSSVVATEDAAGISYRLACRKTQKTPQHPPHHRSTERLRPRQRRSLHVWTLTGAGCRPPGCDTYTLPACNVAPETISSRENNDPATEDGACTVVSCV